MKTAAAVITPKPARRRGLAAVLWLLIMLGAVAVPLSVARTEVDAFRTPKVSVYQALAFLLMATVAIDALFRGRAAIAELLKHRTELMLAAGILLWTAITTLTSTQRELSALSLIWVICATVVFLATMLVARRQNNILLAGIVFIPASVNALLAMMQRAGIYNPMRFASNIPDRIRTTAMVGNPNDLGVYLLFPAIAALAYALTWKNPVGRAAFVLLSIVLAAGILATDTITAIGAYVVSCAVMLIVHSRRAIAPVIIVAVLSMAIAAAYPPLRARVTGIASNVASGNYVAATSLRLPAFATAWEMFKDRPLVGKGPGTYGWWYLPYKAELNERNPAMYSVGVNFGETHNDHLQTLAVAGLPGYLLFLAASAILAAITLRRRHAVEDESPRHAFSRVLALPLALAFLIVTLAQFPLELAATTSVLLHLAALCCGWRFADDEESTA